MFDILTSSLGMKFSKKNHWPLLSSKLLNASFYLDGYVLIVVDVLGENCVNTYGFFPTVFVAHPVLSLYFLHCNSSIA